MAVVLSAASTLAVCPASAQTTDHLRRELEGVEVIERLGEPVPMDGVFVDENREPAFLNRWMGRPIVVTLNYTNCPMLCSVQLAGLARTLRELGPEASADFDLVTVSIDPEDTPKTSLETERWYVGQAGGDPRWTEAWHFLTGDEATIKAVADAVGFHYRRDEKTGEYRHKATLIVLTGDGRVSTYLHGIAYPPEELRAAVARAARGEIASGAGATLLDAFPFNCFSFDPQDGTPTALLVMRVSGGVVLALLVLFLAFYLVRDVRRRRGETVSR